MRRRAEIRQPRAVEAHGGARRAPRQHAGRGVSGAAGDGVRDGAAARRERVRELQQPVARFRRARSTRCCAARRRARRPRADDRGAPVLDEMSQAARRSACCWRRSVREIQANLRHMEQVLDAFFRDHTQARRARRRSRRTASRSAARCACSGSTTPTGCSALCQQQIDDVCRSGHAGRATRTSSCSPNRCRASASTSRRCEQQRPDRDRLIAPLLAKRLGEAPRAGRRRDRIGRGPRSPNCAPRCRELVAEVQRAPADAAARERTASRSSRACATTPT